MWASSFRILLAALSVDLLSGCIREDLPRCTTRHELYIRVAQPDCVEFPAGEADTATVFLFDSRNVLRELIGVGRTALANGDPVEIRYCGSDRPRAVVWGNLETCTVTTPVLGETTFGDFRIGMRSDGEYASVPDNLYYGLRTLSCERTQTILISPAMGRLTITARGLAEKAGERYFFEVGTGIGGYDFLHTPLPGKYTIRLDAVRRESTGDLTSGEAIPLFAYPVDRDSIEPLKVSLYRLSDGGVHLIGQTDFDDKLQEIVPQAGRCVNVMMNFQTSGGIGIDIRVTEWDVVELWEDW